MPNVIPKSKFKVKSKTYYCDGIGWDGVAHCIWYYEINAAGVQISEQKSKSHEEVRKSIKNGSLTIL